MPVALGRMPHLLGLLIGLSVEEVQFHSRLHIHPFLFCVRRRWIGPWSSVWSRLSVNGTAFGWEVGREKGRGERWAAHSWSGLETVESWSGVDWVERIDV